MLYAYIPEIIENLDLSQNFSINELQTLAKKRVGCQRCFFVARAGSRYSVVGQQRHMVTLLAGFAPSGSNEVPSFSGVPALQLPQNALVNQRLKGFHILLVCCPILLLDEQYRVQNSIFSHCVVPPSTVCVLAQPPNIRGLASFTLYRLRKWMHSLWASGNIR